MRCSPEGAIGRVGAEPRELMHVTSYETVGPGSCRFENNDFRLVVEVVG